MRARATVSINDEPRPLTVYNVIIKHDDSGRFLEWMEWQVEARDPFIGAGEVIRLLALDDDWKNEIDHISVVCVPLRSFRFRRGTVEERPPKLVIK